MSFDAINRIWTGASGGDDFSDNRSSTGENNAPTLIDGLGGADILKGFGGNDFFIGGDGNDTITGGGGHDTFAFRYAFNEAVWQDGGFETRTRLVDQEVSREVEVERTGTREVVVNHSDAFTWDMTGIRAPAAGADWKAWDNYEKAVSNFFNGAAEKAGTMAYYEAQGYEFDASTLEVKAAWNGAITSFDDAGSNTSIVYLGPPDSGAKKIANTWGKDERNHDLTDNLGAATSLGRVGQAAFKVVNPDAITGSHDYSTTTTEEYTYTVTETVVETIQVEEEYQVKLPDVLVSAESVVGASQGSLDKILDFSLGSDKLFLATADGDTALTKASFIANFDVTKDANGHSINISVGNHTLNVSIDGLGGASDPFFTQTGTAYGDLHGDALEAAVWDTMVNQNPALLNAAWTTYVDAWVA